MFIWKLKDWPNLTWNQDALVKLVAHARHKQGRLLGRMEALGFDLQNEALLETHTQDVIKSSEIEGEILDADQVRSSIARRLCIEVAGLPVAERDVEGVVEMTLDATQKFDEALTEERFFGWHAALFPTGRSGMTKIRVAQWRDDAKGPMQVVSGPMGREHVHYQALPAERVPNEMAAFLDWFNTDTETEPLLRAAKAHLWFVTIHPFDDGNGRIARAIADMALARSEHSDKRFYSMSAQIHLESEKYYDILESTQQASLDVTPWMEWFLDCLIRAIESSHENLSGVTQKAAFWDRHAGEPFNERQTKVLTRLLDGFDGKMTTSRWASIAHCSQDTAHRDIRDLIDRGILEQGPAADAAPAIRWWSSTNTASENRPLRAHCTSNWKLHGTAKRSYLELDARLPRREQRGRALT